MAQEPQLATNGLRVAATLIVAFGLGCQVQEPQVALGFAPAKLNQVRLSMSVEEVEAILGRPLEGLGFGTEDPPGALWYAEPGATWVMGEYRYNIRGFEGILWFKDGRLERARVTNMANYAVCECYNDNCQPEWSTPCFQVETPRHAG